MNSDEAIVELALVFEKHYGRLPTTGEFMMLIEASASVALDHGDAQTISVTGNQENTP